MKEDFYLAGEDVGMNIIPVMNIDAGYKLQDEQLPNVLPLLPLRNAVLFPDTVIPIPIRREKSIQLLNEAYKSNKLLASQWGVGADNRRYVYRIEVSRLHGILYHDTQHPSYRFLFL